MSQDIWILVQHREGIIQEATFGLIGEAQRLLSELGGEGTIIAVALGSGLKEELNLLGTYGADKVIYIESIFLDRYNGELFAKVLSKQAKKRGPESGPLQMDDYNHRVEQQNIYIKFHFYNNVILPEVNIF